MIKVLDSHEYDPDTEDTLLQAFRVSADWLQNYSKQSTSSQCTRFEQTIDKDGTGVVSAEQMEKLLTSEGTPFHPKEVTGTCKEYRRQGPAIYTTPSLVSVLQHSWISPRTSQPAMCTMRYVITRHERERSSRAADTFLRRTTSHSSHTICSDLETPRNSNTVALVTTFVTRCAA